MPDVNVMRYKWRKPRRPRFIFGLRARFMPDLQQLSCPVFMQGFPECPAEFQSPAIEPRGNRFAVKFRWFCIKALDIPAKRFYYCNRIDPNAELKWGNRKTAGRSLESESGERSTRFYAIA